MAMSHDDPNTLVFEFSGQSESTETAFNRVISTVSETSTEITGFRLELTTADSLDIPFDALVGDHPSATETTQDQPEESTDSNDTTSDSSDGDIPSLRPDALPARALSCMLDYEDDHVRTSDLTEEFEDDDIDTSRVSQTLASLKRRGLVEAKPDPEDNRANLYWPTEKGQQAIA